MHAGISSELEELSQKRSRRLLGRLSDKTFAAPPAPVIFVAGAQRSGTTLVQTLLANGLNAPLLPECHIICDLAVAYHRAKTEWAKTSAFFASTKKLSIFFRTAVGRHLSDLADRYPADSLVLKDPNFSMVLEELAELVPTAMTVICVRDPRDIAASFVRIGQRQAQQGEDSRYVRREIGFICKKINASYQPLMAGAPGDRCFLVKYETVVANPTGVLAKLARKTGLPLALNRIDEPVWLDAERRHQAAWISELEEKPPTPEHVGSFLSVLLDKEVAKVEDLCGPLMERLGYSPVATEAAAVGEAETSEREAGAGEAGGPGHRSSRASAARTGA